MAEDPRKGKSIVRGKRDAVNGGAVVTRYELDSAFDVFYAAKKAEGMRERTLKEYIVQWRYFREWLVGAFPSARFISDITADVIRGYINYMGKRAKYEKIPHREQEGAGLSPYTIILRLRTIRTIFNFLANERVIATNPVSTIKPPRFDKEEKGTFTDEQVRDLLATPDVSSYAGLRDRTLMLLLADGGFRIQEALRLTREHIDVKSRCVHLPAAMNKNRKPRVVPLSAEVIRELLTLMNENKLYFDSEYIFLANYGEPLKADHFRKRLAIHAKKAGIEGVPVTPHQFRSYFCSRFIANGGDLFSLQRIVAHSSIETTRRYVRMSDENIRQQHDQFSPIARLGMTRVKRLK